MHNPSLRRVGAVGDHRQRHRSWRHRYRLDLRGSATRTAGPFPSGPVGAAGGRGEAGSLLFVEALPQYAATEGWQIQQVRATLARLDAGILAIIPGEQVVADLLSRGRVTQEALSLRQPPG